MYNVPCLNILLCKSEFWPDGDTGIHVGYGMFDGIVLAVRTELSVQTQCLHLAGQRNDVLPLGHLPVHVHNELYTLSLLLISY